MAEDISGDILITDMGSPFDVTDSKIIRLNPVTGEQTLLSHGQGANLNGLWIDSAGTILVSDWGDAGNTTLAGVYEVNRSTGMLTPVIQGGYLVHAGAITGLISEPVAAPECGATGALIVVGMIFLGSFRKYFR